MLNLNVIGVVLAYLVRIYLEKFEDLLKTNYLFHFHSNYTDGKNSIKDYFDFSFHNNINTIIFCEHIKKNPSYKFDNFLEEINYLKNSYKKIKVIIGVEAKILPEGELDIADNVLDKINLIGFACHSFPNDLSLYKRSFINLFNSHKWDKYVKVWVHPGRYLKQRNILESNLKLLKELINIAEKNNVYIEKNLKEKLPPPDKIDISNIYKVIIGYDAHCIDDVVGEMEKFLEIQNTELL
jgi:histidinol phosphatase-like PHP family hydrolase